MTKQNTSKVANYLLFEKKIKNCKTTWHVQIHKLGYKTKEGFDLKMRIVF